MSLKELRNRAGISQKDLADALGLHFTTVSKWELGKTEVPQYHYHRLSELLGVPEHDLRLELEPEEAINASAWETRVLASDEISVETKLILMAIKGLADPSTMVVATTFEQVASRLNSDVAWVESRWPDLLESGLVRQLGPINTVVKLLI